MITVTTFIHTCRQAKCGYINFCLFVRLWIYPPRIKLAASNFARRFIGVPSRQSIFLIFASQKPRIWRIGQHSGHTHHCNILHEVGSACVDIGTCYYWTHSHSSLVAPVHRRRQVPRWVVLVPFHCEFRVPDLHRSELARHGLLDDAGGTELRRLSSWTTIKTTHNDAQHMKMHMQVNSLD